MAPPNAWEDVPLGGPQAGPGDGFNNRIDYGNIVQSQVVSQYQQMMTSQMPMTYQQAQKYLRRPEFQYGVDDYPQLRIYQRQAELNRLSYGTSIAGAAIDLAAVGSLPVFAMSALPLSYLNKGLQLNLDRQRLMQNMASDIETYRDRIGMPNISYNQTNQLGFNLSRSVNTPGQFFNTREQTEIHKLALSNDMISGRSKGMMQEDIKQYEKNFKDLLDTVQVVVQTLKTTKEGGMALIKEMQTQGFGTIGQIKQNVITAAAYGKYTGLGAQNIMQVGLAGAQAVQGTPWSAGAGAGMYQAGAAYAGYLARGNDVVAQRSVAMAGGVAQAGAAIAQTQMNMLQSGMGAKLMAYTMTAKGGLDMDRFNRLAQGGVSGYEITSGAAQRAYEMGAGGRALFQRRRSELLNKMAENRPEDLTMMTQGLFEAWRQHKGGDREAQAQVFAAQFSGGNERITNLIADSLTRPVPFGAMAASRAAAQAAASEVMAPPGELKRFGWRAKSALFGPFVMGGMAAGAYSGITGNFLSKSMGVARRQFSYAAESVLESIVPGGGQYGVLNLGRGVGSVQQAVLRSYGMNKAVSTADITRYAALSTGQKQSLGVVTNAGIEQALGASKGQAAWDAEGRIRGMRKDELAYVMQTLRTGIGNQRAQEIFQDPRMLSLLGLQKGSARFNAIVNNPMVAAATILSSMSSGAKSISAKADGELTRWDEYVKENGNRMGAVNASVAWAANTTKQQLMDYASRDPTTDVNRKNPNAQREIDRIRAAQYVTARELGTRFKGVDTSEYKGAMIDIRAEERATNEAAMAAIGYKPAKFNITGIGIEKNVSLAITNPFAVAGKIAGRIGGLFGNFAMRESWKLATGADITTAKGLETAAGVLGTGMTGWQKFLTGVGGYRSEEKIASMSYKMNTALAGETGIANRIRNTETKAALAGAVSQMGFGKFAGQKDEIMDYVLGNTQTLSTKAKGAIGKYWNIGTVSEINKILETKDENKKNIGYQTLISKIVGAQQASDNITKAVIIRADIQKLKDTSKVAYIKDGDDSKETAVSSAKDRDAWIEKLNNKLKDLVGEAVTPSDREAALGRGLSASVNPPVLNYWNNQWVL